MCVCVWEKHDGWDSLTLPSEVDASQCVTKRMSFLCKAPALKLTRLRYLSALQVLSPLLGEDVEPQSPGEVGAESRGGWPPHRVPHTAGPAPQGQSRWETPHETHQGTQDISKEFLFLGQFPDLRLTERMVEYLWTICIQPYLLIDGLYQQNELNCIYLTLCFT